MPAVLHGAAVKGTSVTWTTTGEHMINDVMAGERLVMEARMVRNQFMEIRKNNKGYVEDRNSSSVRGKRMCSWVF